MTRTSGILSKHAGCQHTLQRLIKYVVFRLILSPKSSVERPSSSDNIIRMRQKNVIIVLVSQSQLLMFGFVRNVGNFVRESGLAASCQSSQTPSAYSVLPGFPQPSSALSVAETSIRLSPRFAISVNRQLDHSATLVLSQFTSFVVNLGTSSLQGTWAKLSEVAVKGTRVDLLEYIHEFLDNTEKNQLIWLHGMAGVGKSAVAFTVADKMRGLKVREETNVEKRLAGTFFFSRKHTKRCTAGYFFATLAYQLATNFPSIRKDVNRTIRDNPALLDPDTPLCNQMEALFLQPLRWLRLRLRGCPPLSFIVDALDECSSEPELTDLILSLAQALRGTDLPMIHILLTSRSESHIRNFFQNDKVRPLVREIPVATSGKGGIISLDGPDVDKDICTFLRHSFVELGSRHPDFPQPLEADVAKLASRAGRRPIVASTMMKFIIDDEDNDPRDRLQLMLKLTSELLPGTDVYKFYDRILSTCADSKRAYMHLSIVAALTDPLPLSQISKLLGPGLGRDVQTTLMQLRSVMDIPTDTSLPVNIYHSSVRDYVSDPSNCGLPQAIPESTALLDALSELNKHNHAMKPEDPRRLKRSLAYLVRAPEPVSVLTSMLWLRGERNTDMQYWLETVDGRAWLAADPGKRILSADKGRGKLAAVPGKTFLAVDTGRGRLAADPGSTRLAADPGRAILAADPGSTRLATDTGSTRLAADSMPCGRDWLQTPYGQDWLQTPHGQVWQSTPAASVWVTMEEFLRTLDAINEYIVTSDVPLLPAFHVIQQVKALPDFLMFPVFLAFRRQHHSTSASPESFVLPDRDIIHAVNAFESFANASQEHSQSASDALKYACHNWAVHLSRAPHPWDGTLNHIFQAFCNDHIIPWLEMEWCLKGLRSCLVILSEGQKFVKPQLREFCVIFGPDPFEPLTRQPGASTLVYKSQAGKISTGPTVPASNTVSIVYTNLEFSRALEEWSFKKPVRTIIEVAHDFRLFFIMNSADRLATHCLQPHPHADGVNLKLFVKASDSRRIG
ncbi:hypothetical protein P692DRAFT_201856611 [Suillus brevipes Sb2]|nr:hypothetical protein P692DRAFT_201856611 [Suillus brevipes Sb2]